jgi:hypothetical protein
LIYIKRIASSCKYDLSGQFAAEPIDLVATSQDFLNKWTHSGIFEVGARDDVPQS